MRGMIGIAVILMGLLFTPRAHAQPACDEQGKRLVVRTYVVSLPGHLYAASQEFESLLASHKEDFAEDGVATRCMRALGKALAAQGSSELGSDFQWLASRLPAATQGDFKPLFSDEGMTASRKEMMDFVIKLHSLCEMDASQCRPLLEQSVKNSASFEKEILSRVLPLEV